VSVREWWENATHPLRGLDAEEQFEKIQWGRTPDRVFNVNAPHVPTNQDYVQLGRLRALWFRDGTVWKFKRPYPFLVVGEHDHRLYFLGGSTGAMVRSGEWGAPGSRKATRRIDYESRKGRRRGIVYYYHDHDAGDSHLVIRRDGWPSYQGPYTVRPEGIVG
jgi:hypothetical protein